MAVLSYPKKPWSDGQQAFLMPGMKFAYSASMKKWVPMTPGYTNAEQLESAFGVKTVEEVIQLFADVDFLKKEMNEYGRIWRTTDRPSADKLDNNDVWIDINNGKISYWNARFQTWIQIN